MIDAKPGPGATETADHFVRDQEDPTLRADVANRRQIAVRREMDAGRCCRRIDDYGSNRLWTFELDRGGECVDRVRGDVPESGNERLEHAPVLRRPSGRDGTESGAVVRTEPREDLVSAGLLA